MKRFAIAFGMFVMLLSVARAADTSFAGTWEYDKDKSTAPAAGGGGGGRGGTPTGWTVTQDAKAITIESKSAGRDGAEVVQKSSFNLDGTETTAEVNRGQVTGKNTMKAKWGEGNKTLETSTAFDGKRGDTEMKYTSKDKLELSADGKVLTVTRTREGGGGGGGGGERKLVFNKK